MEIVSCVTARQACSKCFSSGRAGQRVPGQLIVTVPNAGDNKIINPFFYHHALPQHNNPLCFRETGPNGQKLSLRKCHNQERNPRFLTPKIKLCSNLWMEVCCRESCSNGISSDTQQWEMGIWQGLIFFPARLSNLGLEGLTTPCTVSGSLDIVVYASLQPTKV